MRSRRLASLARALPTAPPAHLLHRRNVWFDGIRRRCGARRIRLPRSKWAHSRQIRSRPMRLRRCGRERAGTQNREGDGPLLPIERTPSWVQNNVVGCERQSKHTKHALAQVRSGARCRRKLEFEKTRALLSALAPLADKP